MTGTKAFATPKRIAPAVLASIRSSRGIGASRSRSKDRPFFSNVTVTASMEVVPNRMEMATTPGSRDRTLTARATTHSFHLLAFLTFCHDM